MEVRAMAARHLADLGDRSGLDQMRKDFKQFVPENWYEAQGIGVFSHIEQAGQ
jgi:hypothetical protein